MKYNFMELNTILNLMTAYNLSADELLLIYVTFLGRDEENHLEYFNKWFEITGPERLRELFNSLKEKQIIHKNYNPKCYIPNEIEFNQKFLNSWLKNSLEMGKELWELYPNFMEINGEMVNIKNPAKKWNSISEMLFFYSMQINHNPQKHKNIIELLKWGIENNAIKFGICEFIIGHKWEALEELRNNPKYNEVVSNIYRDE